MAVQERAQVDIVMSNGQKAGQTINELTANSVKLNREIKKLKPGTEAFVKKSQDLQKVNGKLKQIKGEVYGVNKATGTLLSSFSQFIPFSGTLSTISGGVGGVTKQFGLLRAAIISTGIGALVILIGSLIAYFKSSEEGQDNWNKIMKVTGVIIGNLSDILANFGKKLFKTFSDPQQAVKDLWEVIKTNIMNRITGIADTFKFLGSTIKAAFELDWEGVKENAAKVGESVVQTFTGVDDLAGKLKNGYEKAKVAMKEFVAETKKEVEQAKAVADLEAQTNRMEREQMVERKKIEANIAELRLKARQDDQYTAKERLAFINEANVQQDNLLEKDEAIAQNRFEIIKQTNAFSKSTKENLDAQAAAEAKISEVQVQRMTQARALERDRQRLMNEVESDNAKIHAYELARMAEERRAKEEQIEYDRETLAIKLETDFQNKVITEEERNQALIDLERDRLQKILDLNKEFYGAESKQAKKAQIEQEKFKNESNATNIKKLKERHDGKRAIENESRAVTNELMELGIEILGKDEAARKKHANVIKGFELGRITTSLWTEIQSIWKYANENPLNAFFPGAAQVLAGFKTAAAIGRAGFATSKITSQKFSLGGILRGLRHSMGGIPGIISSTGTPVEMEDGEIILNRNVSMDPAGLAAASELNARYGGKQFFEAGGPVNPFSTSPSGGTTFDTASTGGTAAPGMSDAMISEIRGLRQDIKNWPRQLQVNNNLQDTKRGLQVLNELQLDSDF